MPQLKEQIFDGQILSKGLAFGRPFFLDSANIFDKVSTTKEGIKKEILKFQKAVKKSKKQILKIKKNLEKDELNITFDILNTHLEILNDPLIINEIINKIKTEKKSLEAIFKDIILEYKNKIKDAFFKEKALDIIDVFKRVAANVRAIKMQTVKDVTTKSIILSNEISPSDIFEININAITAFVSKSGSYESHAAIIARSKNIPFITKVNIKRLKKINLDNLIVDGNFGKIIINPKKKTYNKYNQIRKNFNIANIKNKKIKVSNEIKFYANITNINEIETLTEKNISGIGLLRTEFLFLEKKQILNENEQFEIYKKIAKTQLKKPCIIRLFDFGGDKKFYNLFEDTQNDFFGDRGIGFLLKRIEILKTQLKAILKTAFLGNIYILIPFVRNIIEIQKVKQLIKDIQKEMNFAKDIKLGAMIETPSAALMIDQILKKVDFISIGSNDLIRYLLATNNFENYGFHPSLMKIISMIVQGAKNYKKELFLCGEITAREKILKRLIDLGIKNFSVNIKHINLFS